MRSSPPTVVCPRPRLRNSPSRRVYSISTPCAWTTGATLIALLRGRSVAAARDPATVRGERWTSGIVGFEEVLHALDQHGRIGQRRDRLSEDDLDAVAP